MLDAIIGAAAKHGDALAAISADRLHDVKKDFDERGQDTSPYFNFEPRDDLGFRERTVLAVASPSAPASVTFTVGGEHISALIPPTYADYVGRAAFVNDYLRGALKTKGYRVMPARGLPCKPIAVHAGLGALGRNNLLYVDGMGSFVSIFLFFTDMPCDYDRFLPLTRMESCDGCSRCVEHCPTGALAHERELADAARCLTMLNEYGGDFPHWLEPSWHHALVGCTRCQYVCPQNAAHIGPPHELAHYDEEQTRAFLSGELPEESLEPLGMAYINNVLPRNLKALLAQAGG